jgi:hypothetical protein
MGRWVRNKLKRKMNIKKSNKKPRISKKILWTLDEKMLKYNSW